MEIAINCDVGEGLGNEAMLFPFITSCSIACGGHAGDAKTMEDVVRLAKQFQVSVGAHPSYPDRENFGRKRVQLAEEALIHSLREQVLTLQSVIDRACMTLHHIKAHGALYNDMVKDVYLARLFLRAVAPYKKKSYLYVPYASVIAKEALEAGFMLQYEAFGDRNYTRDLSLVARSKPDALLGSPEAVAQHILLMHKDHKVITVEGDVLPILADTYCIHGDTPAVLEILTYLSKRFHIKR